ncbi:AraC family transcriptional regulator [Parafrankia colletiae]|uniref:AraC family transcriptional regulator n=1 Tax=Parafrankia colletiae TaxID=573497 RepID=A0A1S1QCW7_9ACTN|nr:AraC family transcriptional regulator [Parafrankia colletiae]MCK9902527.1 AraC family transcriptional regulator [Frankia sp. Cpl3]OHV31487.1 AraC family transcriptional regulator [Parafrankia colletiae]
MDVLSDVIAVMRTGRPRSARVTWHAPWAQRFGSVPGSVGFQVIMQGPCWLVAPDAGPVALAAGDVVFRPHGRGHTLADSLTTSPAAAPCDPSDPRLLESHITDTVGAPAGMTVPAAVTLCGAYQVDPTRAHPLLRDLPELVHLPAHLTRHPELHATVDALATELEYPRPGRDAIVPALLDTLLVHILRTWFDERPTSGPATGWAAALSDPATSLALQAIHRDPARPWTVAALAAEAGLSRAPFARRFTSLVGQPPLQYLTWWRMTTAARLLRESNASLSTVAARVGYTSEFSFASAFKRRYGTAPGKYRHGE